MYIDVCVGLFRMRVCVCIVYSGCLHNDCVQSDKKIFGEALKMVECFIPNVNK